MKSADAPLIKVDQLTVGYGAKAVVSRVDLTVRSGQFVSLLGPNGAGKTTLLRSLARLLPPLSGAVYLDGRELTGLTHAELARFRAAVLTEKPIIEQITAREMVNLGRHPHTGLLGRMSRPDRLAVDRVLGLVGAADLADRLFNQLSDGERQKIHLARALAQEPAVIILDEPTIHLDLKHSLEVMTILRNLCLDQGLTILASLHDLPTAARLSDQVGLVKDGRLLAWGPPEKLLNRDTVRQIYDLGTMGYNPDLGLIEPPPNQSGQRRPSVFVAAGGGSGKTLFPLLAKKGFPLASGPLFTHDIDYHIARSVGATVVAREPLSDLSDRERDRLRELIDQADILIMTEYSTARPDQCLSELIKAASYDNRTMLRLTREPRSSQTVFTDEFALVDYLISLSDRSRTTETA